MQGRKCQSHGRMVSASVLKFITNNTPKVEIKQELIEYMWFGLN